MLTPTISYSDVRDISKEGPSIVMGALGRVLGLGPAERRALAGNGDSPVVPTWAWCVLGVAAGTVVGIRIYKRWPGYVPSMIQGGE